MPWRMGQGHRRQVQVPAPIGPAGAHRLAGGCGSTWVWSSPTAAWFWAGAAYRARAVTHGPEPAGDSPTFETRVGSSPTHGDSRVLRDTGLPSGTRGTDCPWMGVGYNARGLSAGANWCAVFECSMDRPARHSCPCAWRSIAWAPPRSRGGEEAQGPSRSLTWTDGPKRCSTQ